MQKKWLEKKEREKKKTGLVPLQTRSRSFNPKPSTSKGASHTQAGKSYDRLREGKVTID